MVLVVGARRGLLVVDLVSPVSSTAGAGAAGGGRRRATSSCGTAVAVGPKNPSGVYTTLSPELKKIYTSYPDNLIVSPWATTKITAKPPWKIGYVAFAITNPYNQHVLDGLKAAVRPGQGGRPGDGQPDHQHPGDHGRVNGRAADLRDPADGAAGRERDHRAAGGQRGRDPGHQRRREGGRARHPGRHSARPRQQLRGLGLDPEPGPGGRRRPRPDPEGQHRHRQGHRGQPERRGALQPEDRQPEELPRHPRRGDALRQLGRGHGQDRRLPVHRLAPAAARRRPPGRRHDGRGRAGLRGQRPEGPGDRRRPVRRRRPVLVAVSQATATRPWAAASTDSRAPTRTST